MLRTPRIFLPLLVVLIGVAVSLLVASGATGRSQAAPSNTVEFEFHVSDWLHDKKSGMAVKPEVAKLANEHVLCVWGEDDDDSLCRGLGLAGVQIVTLHGSHHFDGGYDKLAGIILGALQ